MFHFKPKHSLIFSCITSQHIQDYAKLTPDNEDEKKADHLPSGSRSRGIFSSSSAILKASLRFSLLLLAFAFSRSTRPGRKVWMMAKKGRPLRQLDLKSVTLIEPCLPQK